MNQDSKIPAARLEEITAEACLLARKTGAFLMEEVSGIGRSDVEIKGLHNFVTRVDRESEKRLVKGLSEILPGCGFIAEEDDSLERAEYTWIVDPLDGTTNFIHRVPLFTISIALVKNNEPLIGIVYEPNLNECFYTWKGAPSFLNGNSIRVSETTSVFDSLFATGFPYTDYNRLDDYLALFRYMLKNSSGMRRLGSAAADLAYVACGRFDGFFEYGLGAWDVAGGSILVSNAGGQVSDFSGTGDYLFGKQIIATNKLIYNEFLKLFEPWRKKSS